MIREAATDENFALCARIKNVVQPRELVTAAELRDDGRLVTSALDV